MSKKRTIGTRPDRIRTAVKWGVAACLLAGSAAVTVAAIQIQNSNMVRTVEGGNMVNSGGAPFLKEEGAHVDQFALRALAQSDRAAASFEAFEAGDRLFGTRFNEADGIGANVDGHQRFTRVPRPDRTGAGQWATHQPARATGPNAQSCADCHNEGIFGPIGTAEDGSGAANSNVHRDPNGGGLGKMIQRNTPSLFGAGGIQRLAEEMTVELISKRNSACNCQNATGPACSSRTVALSSKGVSFGSMVVSRTNGAACAFNTAGVQGVASDLVVRPFQWKGSVTHLRDFNRGAMHNELGMQANEFFANANDNVTDHDGDHVGGELTVGDVTVLTIYSAHQSRPTTRQELLALGVLECPAEETHCSDGQPPPNNAAIAAGFTAFNSMGCNSCHVPEMTLNDPWYQEPSTVAQFRENGVTPGGQSFASLGVDTVVPIRFNLTTEVLENHDVLLPNGRGLGNLQTNNQGKAVVRLFGDLKRHTMQSGLAEQIDEVGTGSANFLTENLWGVGSSAPYMHDGRSPTLTGAILEHGGGGGENAAINSVNAFNNASNSARQNLILFLQNMVTFKAGE